MFWLKLDISPLPRNYSECGSGILSEIKSYELIKNNLAYNVIPVLTILLASIAIVVNIAFCYLVVFALINRILPFRGYSLMLNRSFTDLFVSLTIVIFIALHKTINIDSQSIKLLEMQGNTYEIEYLIPYGQALFTLLLTIDYWAVAGAYGVLALLSFLAIKYPWYYRSYITNRKTVIIMIGVWFAGVTYSSLAVVLSSNSAFNIFNDQIDLIQWRVSTKDYILAISNLVILALAFILVTGSYTATIIFLYKKNSGKGIIAAHLTSMKRMFLNILTFASTCFVMAGFVILPLFLRSHIAELEKLSQESKCKEALHAFRLSYRITVWTAFTMIGWLLRMSVDPIITFILDDRFKRVIREAKVVCCGKKVGKEKVPSSRSVNTVLVVPVVSQTTMISFVQRCSDMNVVPSSVSGQYFRYRTPTFVKPSSSKQKNHVRFDDLII